MVSETLSYENIAHCILFSNIHLGFTCITCCLFTFIPLCQTILIENNSF